MCDYVNKNELIEPREIFSEWISNVQSEIREEYGITFSYNPIGSGSRNMVIRRCDNDYFDLDFQIVMQTIPDDMDWVAIVRNLRIYLEIPSTNISLKDLKIVKTDHNP